jgi:hypothetical protein
MNQPILLILTGNDCEHAISAALAHAQLTSNKLRVLQILASDLYHHGHQDLVATRPSKRGFLLYIRNEVLERGDSEIQYLKSTARDMGVSLDIVSIESEDTFSTSLSEVKKGYDVVFLPKQKRRLFPLFQRTLVDYLRGKTSGRIVAC